MNLNSADKSIFIKVKPRRLCSVSVNAGFNGNIQHQKSIVFIGKVIHECNWRLRYTYVQNILADIGDRKSSGRIGHFSNSVHADPLFKGQNSVTKNSNYKTIVK